MLFVTSCERIGRALRRSSRSGPAFALAASAGALVLACLQPGSEPGWPAVQASSDECSACHAEAAETARETTFHGGGEPGCLVCHRPHAEGAGGELGRSLPAASCESCHAEVVAQFRLPFAHPMTSRERCTSCHPPHGGRREELREHLREDACIDCHLEMRGPFLFEHEGSRLMACLSCHEAHGSANRRLLLFADTRSLCMSCHSNLEQSHVQNPGSLFQDCLACHTQVHGSNWDREFFR